MADLQKYAHDFLGEMVDEAILGTCFEVHRSSRLGTLFLDHVDKAKEEKYKICDQVGYDVFGIPKSGSKKTIECECPNCSRTLGASRFAPHLEKCMGMGRNSSRIASQRIANSGKLAGSPGDDDDREFGGDADWFLGHEGSGSTTRKSSKKRKTDKISTSPRIRGPLLKTKVPSTSPSGGSTHSGNADHNDYVSIDVVGGSDSLGTPGGSVSGSTPKMRDKSPFDPSLGTWEPQLTEMNTPKSVHSSSSNNSKKRTKCTKYSNSKKTKTKRHISQNLSF